MHLRRWLLIGTFIGLASRLPAAEGDGWINLYNGKDLTGWVQHGGKAMYRAEGESIVGETVPSTPNSFLCTTRKFTNFVLELEFKVDPALNSGVQIRSEVFDTEKSSEAGGKTIKIPAGRVHGYQVEIDPDVNRGRMWTAGIYDEARRGWLYPGDGESGVQGKAFSEQGRRTFKPDDWNRLRVECRGDSLKTWLNGVPAADLKDSMTSAGFIALQVHGIGDKQDKLQVRWRNLRLKELP
jgi:hypothetical protein